MLASITLVILLNTSALECLMLKIIVWSAEAVLILFKFMINCLLCFIECELM